MVDHNDDAGPDTIVSLETGEWLERRQLAEQLGITGDRLDRAIASDHVESRETSEGPRYRYVGPPADPDTEPEAEAEEASSGETIALDIEDWTEARESLARLETRLESSRRDVERAVEYARELEEECDRLSDIIEARRDEIDEVRTELDEERGRRRQLEDEYEAVVETLEEMSGVRARYHLERNRREEAEEQLEVRRERIDELQRKLEALAEALEKAEQQGFTAELGALTLEWTPND